MEDWVIICILTFAVGLAMALGALLAAIEHFRIRWFETEFRHSILSFGGGILISSVALVLVPEGMRNLSPHVVTLCFFSGGVFFTYLDKKLHEKKEKASLLVAMLLDFIPEVIALGSLYLIDRRYAYLLGLLIALQNLPEGFNAYREMCASKQHKRSTIIGSFLAMSILGPIAGLSGYIFLSNFPFVVSGIMLFASGGILYLVFQDIAPQARLDYHWGPSLGVVTGFLFGMIGKMMIMDSVIK